MREIEQITFLIDKTLADMESRRKLIIGCPSGEVKNKLLTHLLEDQEKMMGHLKKYDAALGD